MNENNISFSEEEVIALAKTAYENGQASFDIHIERTALLIIDMQREFVQPGETPFWIPQATRMVPLLARVLAAARKAGLPIIHTAFAATNNFIDRPASGKTMPNRYPTFDTAALFQTPEIVPDLRPLPHEILLLKPSYGAFYDTPLDTILRNLGCDTVIVTGTMTNLCCGTTARQAYERGYNVIFGSDLTATNSAVLQEAELQTLRYGFARLLDAQEIIALLEAINA